MLDCGQAGKRSGLIIIDFSAPLRFASRTGHSLDSTLQWHSSEEDVYQWFYAARPG